MSFIKNLIVNNKFDVKRFLVGLYTFKHLKIEVN